MRRLGWLAVVSAAFLGAYLAPRVVTSNAPEGPSRARTRPVPRMAIAQARMGSWYIDDDEFLDGASTKLKTLAQSGKCLEPDKLAKKIAESNRCRIKTTAPAAREMTPEEIYRQTLPSVFAICSVRKPSKEGETWEDGWFASAWALTEDGVLVTNWHVFEDAEDMFFGVANHRGDVFPVIDILACNRQADVAIIRVAGRGFTPLPVAEEPAEVGSWVAMLGHPGHLLFTYTQGHVTRYVGGKDENGKPEHWMSVTAEYAGGASGAPLVNRYGAVVGMAAQILNLESDHGDFGKPEEKPMPKPEEKRPPGKKPDEGKPGKPEEKTGPRQPIGSALEMIVKQAVPVAQIRRVLGERLGD